MLEFANPKAAAMNDFEVKHRYNLAKDAMLEDRGLTFNQYQLRFELHQILVEFESRRSLESALEAFDSDFDNSNYPFIHARSTLIQMMSEH